MTTSAIGSLVDIGAIPRRGGGHESRSVVPSPNYQTAGVNTPPAQACATIGRIMPYDRDCVSLSTLCRGLPTSTHEPTGGLRAWGQVMRPAVRPRGGVRDPRKPGFLCLIPFDRCPHARLNWRQRLAMNNWCQCSDYPTPLIPPSAASPADGRSSHQSCQRSGSSPQAKPDTIHMRQTISSLGMSPGSRSRWIMVSAPSTNPTSAHSWIAAMRSPRLACGSRMTGSTRSRTPSRIRSGGGLYVPIP